MGELPKWIRPKDRKDVALDRPEWRADGVVLAGVREGRAVRVSARFLVDASGLFLNDIAGTAGELEAAYRASYSFDQRNSSFTRVRATGDMSTFEV